MELIAETYKQTEVGLIPSDWDVKEFADVMDGFSSGQTPYRAVAEYYKGDIPWITSGELNYNVITDTIEKITIEGAREANLKMIPKGTFLFAITGLEAAGTRGSCAITGIEATTNQSCMALYPKKGLLITPYLYHYYVHYGNELAFKYCQGTKQQSYTGGIAKKLPIIVPPTIEEQTAIATALSDADALISCLEKLIAKKRMIKQGAMQKLLQPNPDSYREGWKVKRLGEVCLILNNLRIPIKESSRIKGETPYYGANGIQGYIEGFTHNGEYVLVAEDGANDLNNYPINYSSGKIWVNNHAHVLQGVISILSTKFLSYILRSIDFQDILVGGTRAKLNKSTLEKIEIPFPSLTEQTRIATILSDMDTEINALETKLEKYKKVKLGMMQQLLTGKIRLNQDLQDSGIDRIKNEVV